MSSPASAAHSPAHGAGQASPPDMDGGKGAGRPAACEAIAQGLQPCGYLAHIVSPTSS